MASSTRLGATDIQDIINNPELLARLQEHLGKPRKSSRQKITDAMKKLAEKNPTTSLVTFKSAARDAWKLAHPDGMDSRKYKEDAYQMFVKVHNTTLLYD